MDHAAHHAHHEHLVRELVGLLKPVFTNSPQGIYLYLDDLHKACNGKFAKMLGYKSSAEWAANEYPISDVLEKDQAKGIQAYMEASEKLKASTFTGTWVRKDGKKVKTNVILVPITYQGEVFVLHFLSEVK